MTWLSCSLVLFMRSTSIHSHRRCHPHVLTTPTCTLPTRSVAPGATLHLPRSVSMAELRRHKLTFLKLVTQNPSARLSTADTALPLFLDYLQKNVT